MKKQRELREWNYSSSGGGLIPLLDTRPESVEVLIKISTKKYIEVLITTRVRVIGTAYRFNRFEVFAVTLAVAA